MPKGDREILKADPEDGTTPVANLLVDALSISNLSGKEFRAVFKLFRRTYGWLVNGSRVKEAKIPFIEWCEILEMDRSHTSTLLKNLVNKKRVINRRYIGPSGKDAGYYYSINTDVSSWNVDKQLLRKIVSYEKPSLFPDKETVDLRKKETVDLRKKETTSGTNLATLKEKEINVNKEDIYPVNNKKNKNNGRKQGPERYLKESEEYRPNPKYKQGKYGDLVQS